MTQAPKTLLKLLVDQRRWTYDEFAEQFARAAEKLLGKGRRCPTVSESQFRRWTAGSLKGLPTADACRVLRAMFDLEPEALFAPPPTAPQSLFSLEDEITMTAHQSQDAADRAAADTVPDLTLDQLRDDVVALARTYGTLPTYEAFRTARQLRERAEDLRERTSVPVQQQELLILAGQTCALLASAAFDLGSLDNSRRLWRTAALYAETSRFDPLRAFANGALAYVAYFSGEPSQAVNLVHRARSLPGTGDQGQRRLRAIEARAYGHLGNASAARHALLGSRETGHGERDVLHDDIGGEFGFSPERLAMSNAATALLINDTADAETSSREALRLVGERPTSQRSVSLAGRAAADLAHVLLLRGHLEEAAVVLDQLWQVPPASRVTGVLTRTAQVRRALAGAPFRGAQPAGDLAEQCEDFIRSSAQRQLGAGMPALALES